MGSANGGQPLLASCLRMDSDDLAPADCRAWLRCGCPHRTSLSPNPLDPFADRAEMQWLRKWGAYMQHDLSQCSSKLASKVGPPPTRRLLPAYTLMQKGCALVDAGDKPEAYRIILLRAYARAALGQQQPLPTSTGSHVDSAASRVASEIAGKRVEARCWSYQDWARIDAEYTALGLRSADPLDVVEGRTLIGASTIQLSDGTCSTLGLEKLEATVGAAAGQEAWGEAIKVIAHEAEHAAGISNEAVAECYAIQHVPMAATGYGLSRSVARAMASAVWRGYADEPSGYATPRCRRGGPLDLHLRSTVWPK
jgi:hypothetical protein